MLIDIGCFHELIMPMKEKNIFEVLVKYVIMNTCTRIELYTHVYAKELLSQACLCVHECSLGKYVGEQQYYVSFRKLWQFVTNSVLQQCSYVEKYTNCGSTPSYFCMIYIPPLITTRRDHS